MLHGTQLEPQARAAYEALTGHVMQPLVLVDGEFSASLDGLTLSGDRVLEIKCPFKRPRLDAVEDGRGGALAGALRVAGPASAHGDEGRDRRRVRLRRHGRVYCSRYSRSPIPGHAFTTAWDAFMRCVREAKRRR